MKIALVLAFLSAVVFAQTVVPKPDPKNYKDWDSYNEAIIEWKIQQSKLPKQEPKCTTVQTCKAALKAEMEANRLLTDQLNAAKAESDAKGAVITQTLEMKKKYDDAIAILVVLDTQMRGVALSDEQQSNLKAVAPGKALDLGVSIEKSQQELASVALKLKEHDEMAVNKYNALLADYKDYVDRVGQQLAQIGRQQRINNALAIYQALPHYQAPQTINVNVSDCTKLPALCAH